MLSLEKDIFLHNHDIVTTLKKKSTMTSYYPIPNSIFEEITLAKRESRIPRLQAGGVIVKYLVIYNSFLLRYNKMNGSLPCERRNERNLPH